MAPILGILASGISGNLWAPGNSYDSIATATGTGSSGVITFTSIPSTYRHLQIRGFTKSTGGGSNWKVQFNSDTGSNYSNHYLESNGSSVSAGGEINQTGMNFYAATATSTASNVYAAMVMDILDYTSTNKAKTVKTLSGVDTNGGGNNDFNSGLWYATPAAIATITITLNSGSFDTNSKIALYGVK
jgi:hypothetical protein